MQRTNHFYSYNIYIAMGFVRERFHTACNSSKWTKIFARDSMVSPIMATYFIIYIRITASSPNRHARAVFLGRLFIRQISAGLAFPAKPETAYGNAPEPTRPRPCGEGNSHGWNRAKKDWIKHEIAVSEEKYVARRWYVELFSLSRVQSLPECPAEPFVFGIERVFPQRSRPIYFYLFSRSRIPHCRG